MTIKKAQLGRVDVRRFNIEEVAGIIGTSPSAVREMHKYGRGPVMYLLGKRLVCDEADLVAWVDRQKAKTARGELADQFRDPAEIDGAA
ncbi:hypothetical protein K8O93_06735 [Gordonia bronchialis]|uniref:helix-turn-helix transcriptional regulator n=1 Tax=Gordonia bronchialis TaxID=2054 RepID=UPI001CBCD8F4|nr:hypothetical protein [Gordonia bronchialis]UAK39370.1 hypothetical protein K8O93_06735 [Gordonia bronchialis]